MVDADKHRSLGRPRREAGPREIAGLTHRGEDCEDREKGQGQFNGSDAPRTKMGGLRNA